MNSYIKIQCQNAITSAQLFEQACKMAAMRDGELSKEEQKLQNKISKAVNEYTKKITKIIEKE